MEAVNDDARVTFGNRNADKAFCERLVTRLELGDAGWRTNGRLARFRRVDPTSLKSFVDLALTARSCRDVAIAALLSHADVVEARAWLAEAACCLVEYQDRGEILADIRALEAVFSISAAGDYQAVSALCRQYLQSPEGIEGAQGPGGVTPHAQSHHWHFMNLVAQQHAHGDEAGKEALALLLSQKPRTTTKLSPAWWQAMCDLAKAYFSRDSVAIRRALEPLPEINRVFFRPHTEPEAALASLALALTTVATRSGVDLGSAADPSLCFAFLRGPSATIPRRRNWAELRDIPDRLRDDLVRMATGKPGTGKPAAKSPAARKPAQRRQPL